MELKTLLYDHRTRFLDSETNTTYQLVTLVNAQTNEFERCCWEVLEEETENGEVWSEITDEKTILELDRVINR